MKVIEFAIIFGLMGILIAGAFMVGYISRPLEYYPVEIELKRMQEFSVCLYETEDEEAIKCLDKFNE